MTQGFRAGKLGDLQPAAMWSRRPDGGWYAQAAEPLGEHPATMTDWLQHWVQRIPNQVLLAQRDAFSNHVASVARPWRYLSYAQAWVQSQAIAQAIIERGLSAERPLMVLSGNDIEHFLLMLGAWKAGVPIVSVSPAYSLLSQDFSRLDNLVCSLTPGLVYAAEGMPFAAAIGAAVDADVEVVLGRGTLLMRRSTPFQALLDAQPSEFLENRQAAVTAQTIAKFLLTSGSTQAPKVVITTHGMLTSNQQCIRQCITGLQTEPPILVDWLPWSHCYGGSHNLGLVIANGGTLYIDAGKPTQMEATLQNLADISPTAYFNVPRGMQELITALERDNALRQKFFARLKFCFFAGASMAADIWQRFDALALAACGESIPLLTGLGMTETSPFGLFSGGRNEHATTVGLPAPGWQIALVPTQEKLELRYRGPSLTPGYWRTPQRRNEAFDEEGFFKSGDAVRWCAEGQPNAGLLFDGRIGEDFKLASGTFVNVSRMRAQIMSLCGPYLLGAVLVGAGRNEVGALLFARHNECAALADLPANAPIEQILQTSAVRQYFRELLQNCWDRGSGSATRLARIRLMPRAPALDLGELTDKGTICANAVIRHRRDDVLALYEPKLNDKWVLVANACRAK